MDAVVYISKEEYKITFYIVNYFNKKTNAYFIASYLDLEELQSEFATSELDGEGIKGIVNYYSEEENKKIKIEHRLQDDSDGSYESSDEPSSPLTSRRSPTGSHESYESPENASPSESNKLLSLENEKKPPSSEYVERLRAFLLKTKEDGEEEELDN